MPSKLVREPLIHFLVGALLVFALYWATGTGRDPSDYEIHLDETDIARLEADWQQNFRRMPTPDELDSLIDQAIAEEIYYREALRLGLDKDDPVIRRRLYQKMRFLDSEEAGSLEPTETDLQQWLDRNRTKYAMPPRYDFKQIYFGQISAAAARERVDQLRGGATPADLARPISLPAALESATNADIARLFGDRFASNLEVLNPGRWEGPVPSGFGVHAVRITAKTPGRSATLADVRNQVLNDWRAAGQDARQERALARYRADYDIKVAGRP